MTCAWYKCEEQGKWVSLGRDDKITYVCHKHKGWPGQVPTTEEEHVQHEKLRLEKQALITEDNRLKVRKVLRTNPDFVDIVSVLRVHKQGLLSSEDAMQNLQTMVESILGEAL